MSYLEQIVIQRNMLEIKLRRCFLGCVLLSIACVIMAAAICIGLCSGAL